MTKKKMETPFSQASHGKGGDNGYQLLLGRFQIDARRKLFTVGAIGHWNTLLRRVVNSLTLDTFKIQQDRVMNRLV